MLCFLPSFVYWYYITCFELCNMEESIQSKYHRMRNMIDCNMDTSHTATIILPFHLVSPGSADYFLLMASFMKTFVKCTIFLICLCIHYKFVKRFKDSLLHTLFSFSDDASIIWQMWIYPRTWWELYSPDWEEQGKDKA